MDSQRREKQQIRSFKKLAVGYTRVSTKGQGDTGISLEAQRRAIERFAESAGYELIEIFEDVASGVGKNSFNKRDGFNNALNLAAQEDADLIAWDWSRLSRYSDFEKQIEKKIPDLNRIKCAKEGTTLRDAAKEATLTRAEYDANEIARLTKEAMAAKRAEGFVFGNPKITRDVQPLGTEAASRAANELVLKIADILRDRPDRFKMTYQGLAELLNRNGLVTRQGNQWDKSKVRDPGKKARDLLRAEESVDDERIYEDNPDYALF